MQMVYSGVITHVKLYPHKWFSFLQDQHFRPLLWQSKPNLLPHCSATFFIYKICSNYSISTQIVYSGVITHVKLYPHKWSIQGLSPMLNYIHTNGLFRGYHPC